MQNSVWQSLPLNGSDTKEKKAIETCGHNKKPMDSHGSITCLIMTLTIHLLPLHTSQLHLLLPQPQLHLLQFLPCHHCLTVMTPIKTPLCLKWGSPSLRHLASRWSALSGNFNVQIVQIQYNGQCFQTHIPRKTTCIAINNTVFSQVPTCFPHLLSPFLHPIHLWNLCRPPLQHSKNGHILL